MFFIRGSNSLKRNSMEKETLEEAAEINCESITHPYCDREKSMFIKGAEWQAERMYSEEEVREAIRLAQFNDNGAIIPMTEEEIISQFKKK